MTRLEAANKLYEEGLKAFRSGDNDRCLSLTKESLLIGKSLGDDQVVGQALMGLCRVALRNHDENHLQSLSTELSALATQTGDDWWKVVIAHMNAEMARMKEEYDRANALYDESMSLSAKLGRESMVATECFNKSFVAMAQGDLDTAYGLLHRHFEIRKKLDKDTINPYGLIGLATLLMAQGKKEAAAEVTYVCRRLFSEMEIIPDPADELPLKQVEETSEQELSQGIREKLFEKSQTETCLVLVNRYFNR